MAKKLRAGDTVYVPWLRLGIGGEGSEKPTAIATARVSGVEARKVRLAVKGVEEQVVASSAVHGQAGIAIVRIGDYGTESTLLDPLAKSVLQYCRLLVGDDTVRLFELRTVRELRQLWVSNHGAYRHVIFIAHGGPQGLTFGDRRVSAKRLGTLLAGAGVSPKIFLSLCCKTGLAEFSRAFSKLPVCEALIAPLPSIHGAVASQFCQTFLAFHLLEGRTTKVAVNKARQVVPSGAHFRLWQRGTLSK